MRDLEENASVVRNADHSEQPAIDEVGRLSGRWNIDQVEPIHAKNVASQVPRRNGQPLRAVQAMLDVRVKLPAFDVPDHHDPAVSNSTKSVPHRSFSVNATGLASQIRTPEASNKNDLHQLHPGRGQKDTAPILRKRR